MSDIVIKAENEDDNNSNCSILALTTLLQEVKKEEQKSLSDEETQAENKKGETLPESFFDDLYRDEIEAASDDATTDADIQKLQEIIAKKKRILHEDVERPEGSSRRKSRSHSPDTRKRKEHSQIDRDQHKGSQAKRPRNTTDTPEEVLPNRNESPTLDLRLDHNSINQQPPSPSNDCPIATEQANDPEMELENLLKTEDYNSDEEPPNSSQGIPISNTMQPMYSFPNALPMVPTMYNPTTNQMMTNIPQGGYPMMCNMGFPPGFYPPNMMNMQMMGYGLPQMNVPPSNDNEVQCLPVVSNSGLPKIPFKKIKLEKVLKTDAPAEDPKLKIIDACTKLLEKMDFVEPTGKFVYTSTVTKQNHAAATNSVLQKITNVSYNFQSIGPKQNLIDWGLKGIPNANAEIAKKISMSADKYFNKIAANANTTARKLIKEEAAKADKNLVQTEMEVEEFTLSSYLKNSMTQTDALVCRECVVRKRKVGHDIAVQASVCSGSIGSQTSPEVRFNDQLTEGLTGNQLKAMYEFSLLIREPPKNQYADLLRLREHLMNMYNLSQSQHKGIVPFIDASGSRIGTVQSLARDPRIDSRSISDPRLAHAAKQNQMVHQSPVQTPRQNVSNYSQHGMQVPNQQVPSPQFPGRIRNDQQFVPGRPQERVMQIPNQQRNLAHPGEAVQYPNHSIPAFPGQEFPQQDGRKNYGRGGLRR